MKDFVSLAIRHKNNRLEILDQTRLPHEVIWVSVESPDHMVELIKRLAVRGAPLIGVAAALALAKYAESGALSHAVQKAGQKLREARPTAVNLMHAIDRMLKASDLVREAERIFEEDVELCEKMATRAAQYISDGDTVLTHCNSGGLATAGLGTALGAVIKAHQQGKKIHVFVDETRPLLQGARLTAWELSQHQVPFTLITDNMAGFFMSQKRINKIFVGCDRIARNGDIANKIGTYSLAVLAKHHEIPFYVVGPETTFDPHCPTGQDIPIEMRNPKEVCVPHTVSHYQALSPSFDVTPRSLITKVILDTREM